MQTREFGTTELEVTPLGYGTAEIGIRDISPDQADRILNTVLDSGINVIDTAACYGDGLSEERIGRCIAQRRDEYVLVSKCGHPAGADLPEWSPELITRSIDRSLERMRTDHLDVMLLHSCPSDTLQRDELRQALYQARDQGKVRCVGYSGDNEAAELATGVDGFCVLETSLSFADQQSLDRVLPIARKNGLGVIVKRPMANGCWRDPSSFDDFYRSYVEPYMQRFQAMDFQPVDVDFGGDWPELALRFSVYQPGVSTAIVGTTNLEHLKSNVEIVEQGPLADDVVAALRQKWHQHDDGSWRGQT